MVGTLVYQLSDGATGKDWLNGKTPEYYADNGNGIFPQSAQGSPFNAASIASTGDPITNLFEDLAAEQKARAVYDNILRLSDDPDVNEVIKFLRQREIVHFQRFGEAKHTNLRRFLRCTKTLFVRRRRCLCLFLSRSIHINAFNNLADSCPYRQVCKDFNYAAFICKRSILQHR